MLIFQGVLANRGCKENFATSSEGCLPSHIRVADHLRSIAGTLNSADLGCFGRAEVAEDDTV